MQKRIVIELPYPPSVNTYWRHKAVKQGNKYIAIVYTSEKGKAYRKEVALLCKCAGVNPMSGRLSVRVELYAPDRRTRDIDNGMKSLLDALEYGGAYENDSQIDKLDIARMERIKGGKAVVQITQLPLI